MTKLLFVCTGNICRSPMAHAIMHEISASAAIEIESAATHNYNIGLSMDNRTRKTLQKHNIFFEHKARLFHAHDIYVYDYILAMDYGHYCFITNYMHDDKNIRARVMMMRCYDPFKSKEHHRVCTDMNSGFDVIDPYYGTQADFDALYPMLYRSCAELLYEITGMYPAHYNKDGV